MTVAGGCASDLGSGASHHTDEDPLVRIVEVLSQPAGTQRAFVELRNDRDKPLTLDDWALDVDGAKLPLSPLALPSTQALRGVSPAALDGNGLALVFDDRMDAEAILDVACDAPVLTTRDALGPDHADDDDILAGTLALQTARHCLPVFVVAGLDQALAGARSLTLLDGGEPVDGMAADLATAPRGVAFERRGIDAAAFDLSPIGATPGARNFYRSDAHYLEQPDAAPPLAALHSSPWRVGNQIVALTREAQALEASGDVAGAESLRNEAAALAKGEKLPHNPLIEPFDALVASADERAFGAFYQLNEPDAVKSLVEAKQSGVDVRIATDGEFEQNSHYVSGFEALTDAGVPLSFDPRPSALSHDKFLTVDRTWLWTGSFNPIEDEPSRIHADNAVIVRSPGLAALHDVEAELMFDGTFGTDKRKVGLAGGRYQVDGAPISVRFSPGLSASALKKRSTELATTGDPLKACDVRLASDKHVIPNRYRDLDPCGGPYDLIVGEVARATSSIYFVSFSLSLDDLDAVVRERYAAGIDVRGVVDPTVSTRGIVQSLNDAGADVRYTPNSDPDCPAYVTPRYTCPKNPNKVWLHHKFVLIDHGTDHPVLITGSHNLSASAEDKNDEALVVIRDRAIAESYYRMFREVYDHPQTMGGRNTTAGLPALAITEVLPSADPAGAQFVEIENFGDVSVSLDGLELWDRQRAPIALSGELLPGQRLVVGAGVDAAADALWLPLGGTTLSPTTALVLRAADGRWISTYDPYTAEQNLPAGAAPSLGASRVFSALSRAQLDEWTDELLGVNATPEAEVPTWQRKGLYSDWGDEHEVTDTRLILTHAPLATWSEQAPTPGW